MQNYGTGGSSGNNTPVMKPRQGRPSLDVKKASFEDSISEDSGEDLEREGSDSMLGNTATKLGKVLTQPG